MRGNISFTKIHLMCRLKLFELKRGKFKIKTVRSLNFYNIRQIMIQDQEEEEIQHDETYENNSAGAVLYHKTFNAKIDTIASSSQDIPNKIADLTTRLSKRSIDVKH